MSIEGEAVESPSVMALAIELRVWNYITVILAIPPLVGALCFGP